MRLRLSDWCSNKADAIDTFSCDMPWYIGVPYALMGMPVYMSLFIFGCLLDSRGLNESITDVD